jgi:GTP-binding protein
VKRSPVVVIVGRPNVGKSTLFNRLTRSRRALVHDLPGVTRDRIVGEATGPGVGALTVVDTGGLLLEDEDDFIPLIRAQADAAIRGCDLVLFVTDGEAGLVPEDRELAQHLRSLGTPVVVVVNKADIGQVELQAHEFHGLGLGAPVVVSAEHGSGLAELWEAVEEHLGNREQDGEQDDEEKHEVRVAIIGRPNVGKSSLLNRLVGESRVLVSEIPGTTRDAVDVVIEIDERRFRFIDTAGIRRKGRTDRGPEVLAVLMARRHLERAHVCLFVTDAVEGITRQDAHVAGYAWEAGRAIATVVNKWDLVKDGAEGRERIQDGIERQLKYLKGAPLAVVSALTGQGVHKLFPIMNDLHRGFSVRVTASELNRVLRQAWEHQPPSVPGRKQPKLYYGAQVRSSPPGFVLFTNLTGKVHFSYLRYLENILRDTFDLAGVPIQVMIRGRKS